MFMSIMPMWFLLLATNITGAPPGDLASFLEPTETLQTMQITTNQENLLNLLDAGPDTENAYVKKLLAIRALEKMKVEKAIPQLQKIARGDDITLSDAAAQAIAVIEGKDLPRPDRKKVLQTLSKNVPADIGFVLCTVLTNKSRGKKLQYHFDMMRKNLPTLDKLLQKYPQQAKKAIPETNKALLKTLQTVGNLRIDGVVGLFPTNIGQETGYAAFVLKGLCDPEKLEKVCENNMDKAQIGNQTVYHKRYGPAICLVDKNTLVFSVGGTNGTEHMEMALKDIESGKAASLPPNAKPAFETVRSGASPWAASGALSKNQKDLLQEVLNDADEDIQNQPDNPEVEVASAWLMIGRSIIRGESFEAMSAKNQKISVIAHCPDTGTASSLSGSLDTAEKLTRELMLKQLDNPRMASMVGNIFDKYREGTTFWNTTTKDKDVIAKLSPELLLCQMAIPYFMMMSMRPSAPPSTTAPAPAPNQP
ncbi:MAG: hypothetical protein ACLFWL_08025 [Candidatus Brocadiia bacterium]